MMGYSFMSFSLGTRPLRGVLWLDSKVRSHAAGDASIKVGFVCPRQRMLIDLV
jgi:hypothetical protein